MPFGARLHSLSHSLALPCTLRRFFGDASTTDHTACVQHTRLNYRMPQQTHAANAHREIAERNVRLVFECVCVSGCVVRRIDAAIEHNRTACGIVFRTFANCNVEESIEVDDDNNSNNNDDRIACKPRQSRQLYQHTHTNTHNTKRQTTGQNRPHGGG